jgi:hypothetical protein
MIVILSMVGVLVLSLGGMFIASKLSGGGNMAAYGAAGEKGLDLTGATGVFSIDKMLEAMKEVEANAPKDAKSTLTTLREFFEKHRDTIDQINQVQAGTRQESDFPGLSERFDLYNTEFNERGIMELMAKVDSDGKRYCE